MMELKASAGEVEDESLLFSEYIGKVTKDGEEIFRTKQTMDRHSALEQAKAFMEGYRQGKRDVDTRP